MAICKSFFVKLVKNTCQGSRACAIIAVTKGGRAASLRAVPKTAGPNLKSVTNRLDQQ